MGRPLIAVSAALEERDTAFGSKDVTLVSAAYTNAIYAAGGQPVVMPVVADPPPNLLARMDGLLLVGGADLDPSLYGEEPDASVYGVRRERDDFEAALYEEARERGLPVFAICRGMQLINVLRGGNLIQDLVSDVEHWQTVPAESPSHSVEIESDSALADAIGLTADVNSYHHQGLGVIGEGLRVTARCADVIEAVESTDDNSLLAVQWHPEHMAISNPSAQALFKAFVNRTAERATSTNEEERELCPTS